MSSTEPSDLIGGLFFVTGELQEIYEKRRISALSFSCGVNFKLYIYYLFLKKFGKVSTIFFANISKT